MSDYDDHYARWSYEQLLLQQPHVGFDGLWRVGFHHYVVCPTADTALTPEGEGLRAWFHHKCRAVTSPIEIVTTRPEGAERVPERTASERAVLAGAPRNARDTLADLSLALPRDFPPFALDNPGAEIHIVTREPLTSEQKAVAQASYRSLGHFPLLHFDVQPDRDPVADPFRYDLPVLQSGDIDLIPSRRLPNTYGRDLRFLVEEDDDLWVAARDRLFATSHRNPRELLPADWPEDVLTCVVDATVFPPENIRTYLSLYDIVQLALPLGDKFSENCNALGVTFDELKKLVMSGRVRLLLPQPIDRYPKAWIESVAEEAPQNMLFSRRLAAATIADARGRLPLLYPPLSPSERYALLHAIASSADDLVGAAARPRFVQFVCELGELWSQAEWSVQSRGAMGTSHLGIGGIAGALYENITGRDIRLELWSAAQKVEWAAALGAHVFPGGSGGYDEGNACDLVAGVYGPGGSGRLGVQPKTALSAITDLLALDSRVSVVDFAAEFSSSDINRLRETVLKLTRENVDPDYLADAIEKFNKEVRRYERRPDLLKGVNVVGLFSAGAAAMHAVDPSIAHLVPLAGTLLGFVVNRVIDEVPRHSAVAGTVVDYLNSAFSGQLRSDAVLVARAKRDVARLKR
jgi:hypothetical protein